MFNYFLTPEAKEDLWRIYQYGVYKFGEAQADKYLLEMGNCFLKIAQNPLMFPRDEKHRDIDRFCVCGVDTIFYNIRKDEIIIVTIIGRQDFK